MAAANAGLAVASLSLVWIVISMAGLVKEIPGESVGVAVILHAVATGWLMIAAFARLRRHSLPEKEKDNWTRLVTATGFIGAYLVLRHFPPAPKPTESRQSFPFRQVLGRKGRATVDEVTALALLLLASVFFVTLLTGYLGIWEDQRIFRSILPGAMAGLLVCSAVLTYAAVQDLGRVPLPERERVRLRRLLWLGTFVGAFIVIERCRRAQGEKKSDTCPSG